MADTPGLDQLKQQLEELKKEFGDTSIFGDFTDEIKSLQSTLDGFNPVEAIKGSKEFTKSLSDLKDRMSEALGPTEQFDRQLRRTIQTLTGVTEKSDTLIGSFFDLVGQTDGGTKAFKQLGDTAKKTLNPLNVLRSSVQKLAEGSVTLALANDKAMASFNGATGAGGRFNQQILALEKSNRRFGIGAAEAASSLQSLIGGLSGFGLMADKTQTALADEVAELSKLGVAASDTVGVFQSATKTFGMTTDAAMDLNQEAEALAQELGISLAQAVGDLNKALPQLAVLAGDEVEDAFKRLSEQAQETGLSIDQLTSIADRFMTFEQAGKAASNLNAVLGTQMFDTMGLLEAQLEGPQAFIDTFRDQLQGAVGDFDSLTVFQKQTIANAAGLSVVEVRNLMNAEALTDEQQEQAKTRQENLKAAMSLMDELKAVAVQLTVNLSPVINGIKVMLDGIGRFLGFLGQIPGVFGATAQIIAITLIPSLIKAIAQGNIRVLMENRVLAAIQRQNAALRQQRALRGSTFTPMGGGGVPFQPGMGPGTPPAPAGGGGFFGGKSLSKARLGLGGAAVVGIGGSLVGGAIAGDEEGTGSARDRLGGAVSGAATGAAIGSFIPVVGTTAGAVIGGIGGALGIFEEGGGIAGSGPTPIMAHGGEVVVPVQETPAAANLASMVAQESGASNQAVVAAINNLGTKMDALMQRLGAPGDFVLTVNKREFGRLTNEHFGAPGSSPVSGVG
jgi:hypothetical protein